jgi:hypothetical protein
MSNRELLKEAIADAKAVKEMAISNAKAALEEAFTPQLKSLLEKKLTEMDEEDEMKEMKHDEEDTMSEEELNELLNELNEEEDLLNDPKTTPTAHGNIAEEEEEEEEEVEEEEFDLEEMSEEDLKAFIEDVVDEMIEAGELEAGEEEMEAPEMEASEEVTDEESEEETEEEPMMEAKEEKMEEIIDPQGADFQALADALGVTIQTAKYITVTFGLSVPVLIGMIHAGGTKAIDFIKKTYKKLTGKQADESEEMMEEGAEDEIAAALNKVHDDKSLDTKPEVEKALADLKKKVNEGADLEEGQLNESGFGVFLPIIKMIATKFGIGITGATVVAGMIPIAAIVTGAVTAAMISKAVKAYKEKKAAGELAEALETVETLRTELNEVNLLNSKLLYTNKIFKAKNLSETQKVKVLTTFDKAESVKEVKLVYETLLEGLVSTTSTAKEAIKESKSFASKAVGTSPKKPVVETDGMVSRFQKLAGIK